MSILDTVNARLAIKKSQVVASISPLERVFKEIKADADISNAQLVQKDWAKYNAEHTHGYAPKSASGKPVDIGDGFQVHRHGMDANGNHSVWVSKNGGRASKIQTNGNVPTVDRESRSDGRISHEGAAEIKAYHQAYIGKN